MSGREGVGYRECGSGSACPDAVTSSGVFLPACGEKHLVCCHVRARRRSMLRQGQRRRGGIVGAGGSVLHVVFFKRSLIT